MTTDTATSATSNTTGKSAARLLRRQLLGIVQIRQPRDRVRVQPRIVEPDSGGDQRFVPNLVPNCGNRARLSALKSTQHT